MPLLQNYPKSKSASGVKSQPGNIPNIWTFPPIFARRKNGAKIKLTLAWGEKESERQRAEHIDQSPADGDAHPAIFVVKLAQK